LGKKVAPRSLPSPKFFKFLHENCLLKKASTIQKPQLHNYIITSLFNGNKTIIIISGHSTISAENALKGGLGFFACGVFFIYDTDGDGFLPTMKSGGFIAGVDHQTPPGVLPAQ
jgi:hypothetical protein